MATICRRRMRVFRLRCPEPMASRAVKISTQLTFGAILLPIIAGCALAQGTAGNDPVNSGGFPFPKGSPPTGLQAPLPAASKNSLPPRSPSTASPSIQAVLGRSSSGPLKLQDAVALALYTSRSLALAEESLLQSQGRTSEAKAAFNPQLGSTFSVLQLSQATTANIGGNSITLANSTQRQIGVSATLPVDISGMLRTASDQAKMQEIVARLDINRTRNQIVLDVKTAFYDALRAQSLLDVAQESLRNTLSRQSDAQKRLDAGVAAPYDLQRAATDVANAQLQVLSAQNQVSQSLYALKNAIGVDLSSPITITDNGATETPAGVINPADGPVTPPRSADDAMPIPDIAPPKRDTTVVVSDPLPLLPEYGGLLDEALKTRPEIMEADASISAAHKGVILAHRSQLPSLGVVVSGSYQPDAAGLGAQTTSGSAVITLNVPIFEGGISSARRTQAIAAESQAVTNKRQAVDGVVLELQNAYQSLRIGRDSLAVANQSVALAREAFRLARVRYTAGVTAQAGVSPLIEVSDAQTALTQAESNQVNALYNYNNARSRLDKAIGRYAFVFNGGVQPTYLGFSAPPAQKVLGQGPKGAKR